MGDGEVIRRWVEEHLKAVFFFFFLIIKLRILFGTMPCYQG